MQKTPFRIAVLVSGSGSNLQALIDQQDKLGIKIVAVISNKADAYALTRAKNAHIATFVFDKDKQGKPYKRVEFEQNALTVLGDLQLDLVVLAGFMKILTPLFVQGVSTLSVPMINLHPSLLPAYKGLDTHTRVIKTGERYHGCSVHLVNDELDAGQIIAQSALNVHPNDTADTLQKRVHTLEHKLLPMVVGLYASNVLASLPLPLMLWDNDPNRPS